MRMKPLRFLPKPPLAALGAALLLALVPALSQAAKNDTHIEQSGELPKQGRVVLRSGLAWLDESMPVFQKLSAALATELTGRGLTVVPIRPSVLEPLPQTPLPNKQAARDAAAARPAKSASGPAEGEAGQKASELGKTGGLPKLKLRGYATPESDADLSESVKAIAAPDVTRALYARSQQAGKPVVQTFSIPGRLPKEIEADAATADYAIIIRFAAVQAWAGMPGRAAYAHAPLFGGGVLVAASTIGGAGRLGFGAPARPSPPGQSSYGTPGGYARGYEGSAPNDFWHRDNDFYQRDYMFKHGPQPEYATPPSGLSSSRPGARPHEFGVDIPRGGSRVSNIGWHLLALDGFALAPLREGKKQTRFWHAVIRAPGDPDGLSTSLPKMVRFIFH